MPMMLAMEAALGVLEADAQVRVILITGADERAFMAGGDNTGFAAGSQQQNCKRNQKNADSHDNAPSPGVSGMK